MYRTRWQPDQFISFRSRTLRVLTVVALAGYPIGALLAALNPEGSALGIAGSLLAPGCALVGLLTLMSRTRRITDAKPVELDEFELQLRHRAMSKAYTLLTLLVLTTALYLSQAPDWGGWMPSTEDHWRGFFWGATLYSFLLPTATLVWSRDFDDAAFNDEGEQEA